MILGLRASAVCVVVVMRVMVIVVILQRLLQ